MGVDYDGVGGIGVKVSDQMIWSLLATDAFSEEDWEEDPDYCLDSLVVPYQTAGSCYNGEDLTYYLLIEGSTLKDINENAPKFLDKLKSMGIESSPEDLIVISDIFIC